MQGSEWRTEGVQLTEAMLDSYSAQLRKQGRREDSVRNCEKILRQFYDFLPSDKIIRPTSLESWREKLLSEQYAIRTVNSKVSTVNAWLESIGCRAYQVSKQLPPEEFETPELTRQEYVRMLQTARSLEDERAYVLTKLFATTGLAVLELPLVTVEAIQRGSLIVKNGERMKILQIPQCLQSDLLRYAENAGRWSGMIFTKKNGTPLARTQVSLYIQKLAQEAGVPAEKGNIRALRQLYKTARSAIEANFDLLVQQAYERQLELEQLSVEWNAESGTFPGA